MIPSKSKLVLGTVQLGMKYGLANKTGRPDTEESWAILDEAVKNGITTLDTAHAYGDSEDVLGAWIKARGGAQDLNIISKLKPHVLNDYPDGTKAVDMVRYEVEKSLKRLNIDVLDGYLLHTPTYVYLRHVMEGLGQVKKEGLVRNIGVSTYDEAEALQAVELNVDYIQVPYNVFDQRLDATDFFQMAEKAGTVVFARAPFLQGLLLMEPHDIPAHLQHARPLVEKFREIIKPYGITPLEASLRFALAKKEAPFVVMGVEQVTQLEELVKIAEKAIQESLRKELVSEFANMDRAIVNPSLWSKIKR